MAAFFYVVFMDRSEFIGKIKKNLIDFGVMSKAGEPFCDAIGVGISGGADSVSLFIALCEIFQNKNLIEEKNPPGSFECGIQNQKKAKNVPIIAVTVNHHVRSEAETNSDVDFVRSFVEKYKKDFDVRLVVFDLGKGKVQSEAEKRKCGIEEAARFLRYECFEKAILENHISHFCLAHNQNDNLETILMRFLQGTPSDGIQPVREKYVRPLINIARCDIEDFLKKNGQNWRTDSTNFDDNYLRNNIRLNLVPVLDEKFPSWKNAVLGGSERTKMDNDFISGVVADIVDGTETEIESENERIKLSFESFTHDAIAYRVLIKAMNNVGVTERIPHRFLADVLFEIRMSISEKRSFSKRFSCAEISCDNRNVFVKKHEKKRTDFGFFDIIRREGNYVFPFGVLDVSKSKKDGFMNLSVNGKSVTYEVDFPFVVRSPCLGEKKHLFVVE